MKRPDVISFRCRSYWPCLCAWVAWSWETSSRCTNPPENLWVSRWFGGWFKVPPTCLSDSVSWVFLGHIMTQLLPKNFEKYILGTFLVAMRGSCQWVNKAGLGGELLGVGGILRNWPLRSETFAPSFFFQAEVGRKHVSVIYLSSY